MKNSEPIYVIDASSFIFRAYYALAPLSSKGRPSHAVAGFASMLLKIIRDRKPSALVVVFDSKKPSFRKEIYSEYKANRIIPPPDLSDQIMAVMEMCRRAEMPILQQEGIEADDWIGTFVRKYESKHPVVIVSSDKDLAQLVDERVKMFDSFRDRFLGPAEVEEKWGVKPEQMADLLALTGDSSDNIPGLSGVGPKTAAKLLSEHKNIERIYKNLQKLSPKLRDKFVQEKDTLELSKKLVSLKTDLELPFEKLPDLKVPLSSGFRDFLLEWDCTRIVEQNQELLEGDGLDLNQKSSIQVSKTFNKHLIQSQRDLERLGSQIESSKFFAFDCETTSFERDDADICGVSFCAIEGEAWYLPYRHGKVELSEDEMRSFLTHVFENSKFECVAHNSKYDLQVLKRDQIPVNSKCHDTMIMGHLLYADRRSLSLESLSKEFLQEDKGDLKKLLNGATDFSTIPLSSALEYAAQDASLTYKLHQKFYPEIHKNPEILWLYENIELPLVPVLVDMELTGVKLNVDVLRKLSKEMHRELKEIENKIYKIVGHEFNIGSPKQLQKVLFEELKLPPSKRTKTGFSTDEKVLKELAELHEVPRLIVEQRHLAKLTSTYVDVLPEMVSKRDQRLHTHYHQTGTATGRLSSSEPNLQNIPVRTKAGTRIREAFVPEKSYRLLSADYSQVELRLMAHFSEDEKMIEAFNQGRDIHAETAKIIFGSSEKEFRSKAKAINFGVIYGISSFGLSQQLGISRSSAKEFIDFYFERFPKVKRYMDESIEKAKKKLYSETLFGRRRPLPDIHSKNPSLRQMAERMAINAPLQGTAADIMKWAMVQVSKRLKEEKCKSRLLLQVHDELILEVAKTEEERVEKLVRECMTNFKGTPAEKLKVPLVVDTAIGESWAEI